MVLEAVVVHRPVTLWFGPKIVAYCSPAVARVVVVFAEGFVEGRRRGCSRRRNGCRSCAAIAVAVSAAVSTAVAGVAVADAAAIAGWWLLLLRGSTPLSSACW